MSNHNGFDANFKKYLAWAAMVGALAVQMGVILAQLNAVRETTKENALAITQLQLQAVERSVRVTALEQRMMTLESRFELLARAFVNWSADSKGRSTR